MVVFPRMFFQFSGEKWEIEGNTGVMQGGSHSAFVFRHVLGVIMQDQIGLTWGYSLCMLPQPGFSWMICSSMLPVGGASLSFGLSLRKP